MVPFWNEERAVSRASNTDISKLMGHCTLSPWTVEHGKDVDTAVMEY